MKTNRKKVCANLDNDLVDELNRIAKDQGKTRTRIIYQALVEYCDRHATPNVWKTEHFEVDFNGFNKIRRQLMDLENRGVKEIGMVNGELVMR